VASKQEKKTLFRPFYQISVFNHFLAFLNNWRLRKTNRYLRNIKKSLFLAILPKFGFFLSFLAVLSHWRLRKSNRWLRYMKKKTLYLGISSKFGVLDHFWHFSDSEKSSFSIENTLKIDCSPRI
jgi:hypothetical protein